MTVQKSRAGQKVNLRFVGVSCLLKLALVVAPLGGSRAHAASGENEFAPLGVVNQQATVGSGLWSWDPAAPCSETYGENCGGTYSTAVPTDSLPLPN